MAREANVHVTDMYDLPFEAVKNAMVSLEASLNLRGIQLTHDQSEGVARPSFVQSLLEKRASMSFGDIKDGDIKGAAATMYVGGQDTVSGLQILLMASN